VSLAVPFVFALYVQRESLVAREVVDLHRVVDDEVHGDDRVDLVRVSAEPVDYRSHGREVHDAGHSRKVLQNDARGAVWYFLGSPAAGAPRRERFKVPVVYGVAVVVPGDVLEEYFYRHGESRNIHPQA